MLDKRHLDVCKLLSIGTTITEISKTLGMTRQTIYDWKKQDEFKATLDELGRDFISAMQAQGRSYAPRAMAKLIELCESGGSDKTQLDAASKIIDKYMSNATKIEINTDDSDDTVSNDVLDKELSQIDDDSKSE